MSLKVQLPVCVKYWIDCSLAREVLTSGVPSMTAFSIIFLLKRDKQNEEAVVVTDNEWSKTRSEFTR